MHAVGAEAEQFIHRNLTPRTILVKFDNSTIFTSFEYSKIPSEMTVASAGLPIKNHDGTLAPEIQNQGLVAANSRSDIYALCASLKTLFDDQDDVLSSDVLCPAGPRRHPPQCSPISNSAPFA
jgi:hypothetical protein